MLAELTQLLLQNRNPLGYWNYDAHIHVLIVNNALIFAESFILCQNEVIKYN